MHLTLPLLIASFLLLTACTSYDRTWVKTDASREQRKHQQTACEAEALRALPPNEVRASSSTRHSTCPANQHNCKQNTAKSDTGYTYTDTNRRARETLVKDCMYRNGWRREKVERPFIKW